MIADALVRIAELEIGVEEADGSNCGPRVNQYKSATNLPPGESWPWCAAFVDWCVWEAMNHGECAGQRYTFTRPTTAGAWDLKRWSLAQDVSTQTKSPVQYDIHPGDIVIFRFSHVGIATSKPDVHGFVQTIEGNSDLTGSREGGAVGRHVRRLEQIATRIRFMV